MRRGLFEGLLAYFLFGILPVFWKLLGDIDPFDIVGYRILTSVLLLIGIHTARRRWAALRVALQEPRVLPMMVLSGALLATNWSVFIWAVDNDRIVEASLGYFMTPLVSVVLGVGLLGERLPRMQWTAIGVAFIGVAWLVVSTGTVPWVSLVLAASFGLYGLIRKTAAIESLDGLTVELMWLLVPACAYLVLRLSAGEPAAVTSQPWLILALAAAGLATAGPLLLFASSARKIPLATLGLLQFLTPSMHFVLGVWAYGEDFDAGRLVGYMLIWAALIGFTYDAVFRSDGLSSAGLLPTRATQTQSRQ